MEASVAQAEQLCAYLSEIADESRFISFSRDEYDGTPETEFLNIKQARDAPRRLCAGAWHENQLIGLLTFSNHAHRPRLAHRGEFGVTTRKHVWGQGLGRRLIELLLQWAPIVGITKVELTVSSDNERAVELYKRMGFVIEGTRSRSMLVDGEYVEAHDMGIEL